MRELSYLKLTNNHAKVVCTCGWESESFRRGPFDPAEALAAYSVEHLSCVTKPLVDLSTETDCIRIWPWESAPSGFKKYSKHDGDEDGVAWVPMKYVQGKSNFDPAIERLWNTVDEDPEIVEFDTGVLVIWGHS